MRLTIIITLFFISAFLLGLDHATDFEINHSAVYFSLFFIALMTLTLLINYIVHIKNVYLMMIVSTLGVFCFVCYIFKWGGEWRTQTILYQNRHLKNRTVEFQMVDEGAFGYRKRTIDRIKLIPFFDWTEEVEESEIDTSTWDKVNIDVNELGIKES